MAEERDPLEELSYMSGVLFAHEILMAQLAKVMIASGIISHTGVREVLEQLEATYVGQEDYPDFETGYDETVRKLTDRIR